MEMALVPEELSFGNFDGLSPEDRQKINEILHGQKIPGSESKVEFPWDTSDTFTASGKSGGGYGDSLGYNPVQYGPNDQYIQSGPSSTAEVYQSSVVHSAVVFQAEGVGYDTNPTDGRKNTTASVMMPLQNHDVSSFNQLDHEKHGEYHYSDQQRRREVDESYSRGAKPYERRNKKKRPPDYYLKAQQQEVHGEIQMINPEIQTGNWHEQIPDMEFGYTDKEPQYIDGHSQIPYQLSQDPSIVHSQQPAPDSRTYQPGPDQGRYQAPAPEGRYQAPAPEGRYQAPASARGTYQLPRPEMSNYQPPPQERGVYQQPPPERGSYHNQPPPQERGSFQPPPQERGIYHNQPPPQERGSYQPPVQNRGSYPGHLEKMISANVHSSDTMYASQTLSDTSASHYNNQQQPTIQGSAQHQNVNTSFTNFPPPSSNYLNSQNVYVDGVQRSESDRYREEKTVIHNSVGGQQKQSSHTHCEGVPGSHTTSAHSVPTHDLDSQHGAWHREEYFHTESAGAPPTHPKDSKSESRNNPDSASTHVIEQFSDLHISQSDNTNRLGESDTHSQNIPIIQHAASGEENSDLDGTHVSMTVPIDKVKDEVTSGALCSDIDDTYVDAQAGPELDPEQYPTLGASKPPLHSAIPSQFNATSQHMPAKSNSSQGAEMQNSDSNSASCDPSISQITNSSSGSVWGGSAKGSWAGLFRNVDPAQQGHVFSCDDGLDNKETHRTVPQKVQTVPTPLQLVKTDEDPIAKQLGGMLKVYKVLHNQVGLQPRGLNNRGNWCYINATLQALVSCPPFYNLMKIFPVYSPVRDGKSSTPIVDSIVQFVNEFTPCARPTERGRRTLSTLEPGAPFEPTYVYKMLQVMEANPSFKLGKQEDAEEFLSSILDGMHEEMSALIRASQGVSDDMKANGYVEGEVEESSEDADPDAWEQVGPKKKHVLTRRANFDKTPLADIFVGYTRSALFKSSSKDSATLQPFFTLQLDIQSEKVMSVRDALDGLVSKESVSGFTCSQTKAELDVMRRVTLEELPSVLILHLKFFVYDKDGGSQKLMKKIDYTIELEITKDLLSPNVRNKLQIHQRTYKLFAVVYHHGKKATGGHYTTAVFHPAINNWIMIDDSSVKQVNIGQVLKYTPTRVPYLLYYRRVDMH